MNEDVIADLKQFIANTVRQEISGVMDEIQGISERIDKLEKKVDDGFAGVGDAIEEITNHVQPRLDDHETRITKLEATPA